RLDDGLRRRLGIVGANVNGGVVALNDDRAGRIVVQATDERHGRSAGVVNGGGVQVGHFLIVWTAAAFLGNRVAFVEYPTAARGHHALRVIQAGRFDQLRQRVEEQVGGRASRIVPVAAELEEAPSVPIALGG